MLQMGQIDRHSHDFRVISVQVCLVMMSNSKCDMPIRSRTRTSTPSSKTSPKPSSLSPNSTRSSPSTTTESSSAFKRTLFQNKSFSDDGSSAKVVRKEQSLIGYVQSLSDKRRNRVNTLDYCTFVLQTSPKDRKDGLLYSAYKRPLLFQSADNHTPIKLTHFTYTEEGDKIIVNDMTTISTPQLCEYSFQYDNSTLLGEESVTILDVLNKFNEWDMVSVRGKIVSVKQQRTVGSPRKTYKLLEAMIADETGTIPFDIWENQIDEIKQGKSAF